MQRARADTADDDAPRRCARRCIRRRPRVARSAVAARVVTTRVTSTDALVVGATSEGHHPEEPLHDGHLAAEPGVAQGTSAWRSRWRLDGVRPRSPLATRVPLDRPYRK